ncbi:MAG: hypothetical protein K6F00_09415 [Lachnospiraceae bacterium]|nr:hypothetical protein [Lachnospiraceae bacterium]
MDLSTDLQCILFVIKLFLCYTFVMVLVPAIVFGPVIKKYSFPIRMMSYYCIGNVVVVNIVFLLTFLKISNRATLILVTLFIYLWFYLHVRKTSIPATIVGFYNIINLVAGRVTSFRTLWIKSADKRKAWQKRFIKHSVEVFFSHIIEWAMVAALIVYVFYEITSGNIAKLGYHTSDMPVHTYWINHLDMNDPFVAGIYPMGFHCVIYYIHLVFGERTMNVIMFFGTIIMIYVLLMMICMLKIFVKNRYIPVFAAFLFASFRYISEYAVYRYLSGLPQEYALIFIFPSVGFAMAFFQYRIQFKKVSKLHWKPASIVKLQEKVKEKQSEERSSKDKKPQSTKEGSIAKFKFKPLLKKDPEFKSFNSKPDRFAGAKTSRERKEFEKLAQQIQKEKAKKKKSESEQLSLDETKNIPDAVSDEAKLTVQIKAEQTSDIKETQNSAETEQNVATNPVEVEKKISAEDELKIGDEYLAQQEVKEKVPLIRRIVNAFAEAKIWIKTRLSREYEFVILMFAFAFAMTISAHFYATIAAAMFYFGMAAGYIVRFIRPRFFLHIFKGLIIGLIVAILPMAVGYASGIDLQGSLYWALSIMRPSEETVDTDEEDREEEETSVDDTEGSVEIEESETAEDTDVIPEGKQLPEKEKKISLLEKVRLKFDGVVNRLKNSIADKSLKLEIMRKSLASKLDYMGVSFGSGFPLSPYTYISLVILALLAIIMIIPDKEYSMALFSFFFGTVIMLLFFGSTNIGLPEIMEYYRMLVFMTPFMACIYALVIDALVYSISGWMKWKYTRWIRHALALFVVAL